MINKFALKGLRIQRRRFGAVEPRRTGSEGGGRVVSAEVLASTRTDKCKCEDPRHMAKFNRPPLRVGTLVVGPGGLRGISPEYNFTAEAWEPVEGGQGLGSGCTPGKGICPRLDAVRRAYGC